MWVTNVPNKFHKMTAVFLKTTSFYNLNLCPLSACENPNTMKYVWCTVGNHILFPLSHQHSLAIISFFVCIFSKELVTFFCCKIKLSFYRSCHSFIQSLERVKFKNLYNTEMVVQQKPIEPICTYYPCIYVIGSTVPLVLYNIDFLPISSLQ